MHFLDIGSSPLLIELNSAWSSEPPRNSIYLFGTEDEEIKNWIDIPKSNKSTGLGGITNYIVKVSAITIISGVL